ncbi:preprotein translocase subunit SecG [Anaerolineales bacterium HSG6]|nr:preprotein translocase subunit SecG [Anaerolineales bacterium HSG6]MDM8529785.1 preprotein translocase subunit SecG [Anaerolineales bacterium HSG25]
MIIALQIIQIILSITIVGLVLMQAKGSGLGSAFGDAGGVYRTRRGVEQILHQVTIGLAIVFCLLSLLSVVYLAY